MIPLAFLLALVAVTIAVLVVAAVALGREMGRLGRALAQFESDSRPVLDEIQQDAQRVADRMERIRAARADDGEGSGNAAS